MATSDAETILTIVSGMKRLRGNGGADGSIGPFRGL
jgi:hypothetical protein